MKKREWVMTTVIAAVVIGVATYLWAICQIALLLYGDK
jgi:hypothetical protein